MKAPVVQSAHLSATYLSVSRPMESDKAQQDVCVNKKQTDQRNHRDRIEQA